MNGLNPVAFNAPRQKMKAKTLTLNATLCCRLLYSVKYTLSCTFRPTFYKVKNEKNAATSMVT